MMKTEKRVLCLLLCVLMLVALLPRVPAVASGVLAEGTCGESVSWALSDTGTLTVSGTGPMKDYAAASNAPWYSSRTSIKAIKIGEGVTVIGDQAFYNCTALKTVTIGSDVTTVGNYAFRGCTQLETVTLPASVTTLEDSAFRVCTSLKQVRLEGNAPAIGKYVFNDIDAPITIEYYEGSTGYDTAPWSEFTYTTMHHGTWVITTPATCTTSGTREIWCTYCEETITETYTLGHQYVDDVCTVCNYAKARYSGTCGSNVKWQLDVLGTLTISGSGSMISYAGTSRAPWYEHRQLITNAVIQSGVTSIGGSAFYGCSSLTSITIADSVTSIGMSAFSGCTSLTSVIIPDGVTSIGGSAFCDCTSLTDITIPDSVTDIASYAFYRCSSLENVYISDLAAWCQINFNDFDSNPMYYAKNLYLNNTLLTDAIIPDGVTRIGAHALRNCSSLKSITIPDSVIRIGDDAFADCTNLENVYISDLEAWCQINFARYNSNPMYYAKNLYLNNTLLTDVTIPDSVTGIKSYTFRGCRDLTSVTIHDNVTSIGYGAFSGCSSLPDITIPDSVTSIDGAAFSGCSSLTDITIPDSVTSLGDFAFSDCTSLTDITIPDSVTSLGNSVFCRCSSLTDITIPNGVTSIGWNMFINCSSLTDITIPDSVTSIGSSAFYNCSSLTSITIPDSVTSIGEKAFYNCSSLTDITIPDSVTSIGWDAFANCSSLTSITIPDSVTSICGSAFENCSSLVDITFCGSAPTFQTSYITVINDCFSGVTATVYYPCNDKSWTAKVKQNYGGTITWKANHSLGEDVIMHEATCTEDATTTGTCLICKKTITNVFPGTATGHSYDDNGFCTVCGPTCTHSFAKGVWTTPRTCTEDGWKSYTCTICGYVKTARFPATGHSYENGTCTTCGESEILPGDVTGDGNINIMDVAKLYAHVKGAGSLTDVAALKAADYTGDGKINIMDVAKLYAHVKGAN